MLNDSLYKKIRAVDETVNAWKGAKKMSEVDNDRIYTSRDLHEELNTERKRQGLDEIPAINALRGGTGTIARKDKSWDSVPGFFVKLFKKK